MLSIPLHGGVPAGSFNFPLHYETTRKPRLSDLGAKAGLH